MPRSLAYSALAVAFPHLETIRVRPIISFLRFALACILIFVQDLLVFRF